jgi:hypothetical protein
MPTGSQNNDGKWKRMNFRKQKAKPDSDPAWSDWIDMHRPELRALGLPPEVCLSAQHWLDFLENGHLHWHPQDSTGFDFKSLSREQLQRLRAFLEQHREFQPEHFALRGYLDHRLA